MSPTETKKTPYSFGRHRRFIRKHIRRDKFCPYLVEFILPRIHANKQACSFYNRRNFFMENFVENKATNFKSKLELIYGGEIMEKGFTHAPNLLIRNYRKLGIEHGEFSFLMVLLTFKHGFEDPFPSRKELAKILGCSERQISKWIASLRKKEILKVTRNKMEDNTFYYNSYNFEPLIQKLKEIALSDEPKVHTDEPEVQEPEVHNDEPEVQNEEPGAFNSEPEVQGIDEPEVPIKKDLKRDLKDKEIKRDLIDLNDSINSLIFEKYKDQITEQEFQEVLDRIREKVKAGEPIFVYESYLETSVQTAIQDKATKKRTFNMFYKRNEKKQEQPKEQKQPEQPKPKRKSSPNQKQEIPVVDYSNEEVPAVTEEELEKMIRFAEEMAAFKPEGVFYRQQA